MLFIKYLLNSFYDFFPEISCKSRYHIPPTNLHIHDCSFQMFSTYTGEGGVIYHNVLSIYSVIESCFFFNCYATSHGGAIYLLVSNGACALQRICSFNCSTGSSRFGQFSHISVSSQLINKYKFMSILFCSPDTTVARDAGIYIFNGKQTISSSNFSNNNCRSYSSIQCSTAAFSEVIYSIFQNNHVSSSATVYFNLGIGLQSVNFSNFINNTGGSSNGVLHAITTTLFVQDCVFSINRNVLFSGIINIIDSFIQHSFDLTTGSEAIMINNKDFEGTLYLTNFGTARCITPIPLPTSTPSQTNLGGLEITLCATNLPPPTPHQTIPNLPTECIYSANNELSTNLFSIFYFIYSSTILITFVC